MNLVMKKLNFAFIKRLTLHPSYQVYIHLKDHDKKINPKNTKLNLSYMDPKNVTPQSPKHAPFSAQLKKSAEQELQKKLFEDYKQKILSGKLDEEQIVQADPLWGERQKPVHYYRNLSNYQVNLLSHSIIKDAQQHQWNIVKQYLQNVNKITTINQAKSLNDLAALSVHYRLNNETNRQKYYEIQKSIGNKFHLLSDTSLILLKYAFLAPPKQCSPNFNRILNDLITETLPNFSTTDLIHLMYFNRYDNFKLGKDNLQLTILQQLENRYHQLSLRQKVDFLFLYVDSRSPTIRKQSHNRHFGQIRNKTQQIICLVNLDEDLSSLSQLQIFKLTYVLVRAKTNKTEHLTNAICEYLQKNLDKMSLKYQTLMLIYLAKIQSNKSILNLQLLKSLKQKVIAGWAELNPIDQIRSIDALFTMNLFDETLQQLYAGVAITSDNTLLGYFCRLEMMNSSGRQWQIIHRLTDLDFLPHNYFQDYKRFYNYVSVTAPDWDLSALRDKLLNTQLFFNAQRFGNWSMDKKIYSQIVAFQKFSGLKSLPKPFKIGCPVKNIQFVEFALPQYQISLDVVTDVERIRGTKDLKGSYQAKLKSLQNIGWKHLYVFEEDVENLNPIEFFDYIYSVCEPYFEDQLKVIATYEQYRSYEIQQLRQERTRSVLTPKQLEKYLKTGDYNIVFEDEDQLQEQQRERRLTSGMGKADEIKKAQGSLSSSASEQKK